MARIPSIPPTIPPIGVALCLAVVLDAGAAFNVCEGVVLDVGEGVEFELDNAGDVAGSVHAAKVEGPTVTLCSSPVGKISKVWQ